MPKQKLFDDDSEEEVSIKIENEYAKKYDQWRGKEEIHKLEQKYGSKALNSDASISSDSEDDSDEPPEVSEEVETQFLKTLALLKKKDPRIYDPGFKFFDEKEKESVKETKEKTLTFADSDDDVDEDDGNIFSIEKKADIDSAQDPEQHQTKNSVTKTGKGKLKEYLTGKEKHLDSAVEKDLEPLKALWSDPALDDREAFLRDYILNKKYLEAGGAGEARDRLRDDDALEADELTVEEQGNFERAYNFRFEEPDHEYLKRFPRTMSYIRPKDDRRSRKRAEVRTRKEEEKTRKMEEIARLKALKLKEIQEKIAKIKEVTGNEQLGFKEEDIEGEFDPEEHDRRMRAIFDEQYYGHADQHKPVFPDLDQELEIENWDKYEPENEEKEAQDFSMEGPHCEDPEFNMDADYEAGPGRATLLDEMRRALGKRRRHRKNKSKLAALLAARAPVYLGGGGARSYADHMDEYYRMDCEDVVGGDLPTRFKYREVVPNDYGLTVEEILLADDKELTQWVPLKKIVRHKPESVQKNEVHSYKQKAADLSLKRKVLPSLFKDLPEEPELVVPADRIKKKKKKKKNKQKEAEIAPESADETAAESKPDANENSEHNGDTEDVSTGETKTKKKKAKRKHEEENDNEHNAIDNNNQVAAEDALVSEAKVSKKKKHKDTAESNPTENVTTNGDESVINESKLSKRQKKNRKKKGLVVESVQNAAPSESGHNIKNKKRKLQEDKALVPDKKKKRFETNKDFKNHKLKNNDVSVDNPMNSLSDERLKAYGLKPKKYRSFLKYKKF